MDNFRVFVRGVSGFPRRNIGTRAIPRLGLGVGVGVSFFQGLWAFWGVGFVGWWVLYYFGRFVFVLGFVLVVKLPKKHKYIYLHGFSILSCIVCFVLYMALLFKHEFTIVSAFLSNVNARDDRNIQKYIDYGTQLMALPIRQIVFLEGGVFDAHFRSGFASIDVGATGELGLSRFVYAGREYSYMEFGWVAVVMFERSDMYFEEVRSSITEFSVDTPHPNKDTIDYMFVQCHKTDWVAMAIALELARAGASCGVYAWLDFGIRHMYRSDAAFQSELHGIRDRCLALGPGGTGSKVLAAGCWNPQAVYYQDIYRQIHWIFAGSVFAGSASALLEFAHRTKTKCLSIVAEQRRLMWEVNVWYMVFLERRALFAFYHGDHNATILKGLFG